MSKRDKGQAAVYDIVAFNFDGKDTAKEKIKEAKKAGALDGYDIVVEAIVERMKRAKCIYMSRATVFGVVPLARQAAAC